MLLMFPTGTLDRNQLLFAVAAYNFANFMVKEFDLSFEEAGPMSMLTIHGFFNLDEILHYYKMIYGADGYATALDKNVAILPISDDNYETLMRGKTLEEYVEFFQENFGEAVPELAARWKARMAAEQIKEEEAKAEEAEAQDSENIPEEKPEPVKKTVRPKEQRQQQAVEEVVVPSAVKDTVPVELPAVDTMTVRETETLLPADVDTVSVQPVVKDTVVPASSDTVSAVVTPVEQPKELTLKEIEELRKREADEVEARKEEARKAFEAQQKAEKELQEKKEQCEEIIRNYLPKEEGFAARLAEAMNYSMEAGGKRLRPILMGEAYRMFGGTSAVIEPFQAAMEMIHTSSLIHDDLPAIDNDQYRRGKKTTHAVYGLSLIHI